MGDATSHLSKLDTVQHTAERIGRFTVESLSSRRETAAVSFTLKLLNGDGRGVPKSMVPELVDNQGATGRKSRHTAPGLQLVNRSKVNSLNAYKRSYLGTIHSIWAKIPQDIIKRRQEFG